MYNIHFIKNNMFFNTFFHVNLTGQILMVKDSTLVDIASDIY